MDNKTGDEMHPMHRMKNAALALLLSGAATLAAAQEPTTLHMSVFPGAVNILLTIGQEQGMFAKHGLKLDIKNTPDSDTLRNGLADGTFDLVHAGADNAIAMVEAQGKDVAIVIGGDQGMLEFMARNDINSFADVRGKSLAVDAPNTAYALVAKKILKLNGLIEGKDYTVKLAGGTRERSQAMSSNPDMAVGMLNVPYSIIVKHQGLKSMGQARSFIGPYQAGSGFVLRSWAKTHPEVLERYLAAYIESQRWTMEALAQLLTPGFGMAPDARLDVDGLRKVLALRAEIEGQWGGTPPAPDKYLELGYYERALKSIR
jgi:ABC-type nitrate/sulfonate/bicarbonate transport system substrate-binding protein